MDKWVDSMKKCHGFKLFDHTSMDKDYFIPIIQAFDVPKWFSNGKCYVKFPINEQWRQTNLQIEEYLDFNQGTGSETLMHSQTDDIIHTVGWNAKKEALEFRRSP